MYDGVSVLDVHGHVSVPQSANSLLVFMMGSNTPADSPIGRPEGGRFTPPEADFRAAAQRHVDYMDERNIDVQVIGPRPFTTMGWMQDHLIPAWARYVNDMIHQQCAFFPDRFVGACQLPQVSEAPDLAHCLDELDRGVREYGFGAAYVSPDPAGRRSTPGMHEPYWYPLYERCQQLGVPIIVHGTNALDRRYRVVPHNYQLGFLTEQYLAGQFLSHGDVFERFPELKVMICHCGGALNRFIPTDPHLAQKDLSRNLFYDTCAYDLIFLEAAIKQRGVDQMCFGTEAPGSGRAVRPETGRTCDDLVPVIDSFGFLSGQDKLRIFHDNPATLVPALAKPGGQ
ncbi:MAG: amidohydrolase family protein [Streptosporangiaceae bacterium]